MEPTTTLWKLDSHTRGKHLVLRNYLDAWFPIMGTWNGRILFIDGFAGPGKYEGGEDGSPIIALSSVIQHRAQKQITAEVIFLFIEKDELRAEHLQRLVDSLKYSLPAKCKADVIKGVFDETMTQVLDQLDTQAKRLAPCFVMVDPFGVSGTPMSVMRRILQNPKSEVYISFMYSFIHRFKESPEFEAHLDQLFGTADWRYGVAITDAEQQKQFYYDLYESQLRKAGAMYVVHFELFQGQRLVYAIFFGTQNLTGCDRMKQAIWKVAPFGDSAFRAARSGQLTLGLEKSDFEPLKEALRTTYRGSGWVNIQTISDFVASDQTDYHTSQFKRGALVPMEDSGEIEVDKGSRKRKHTYPDGTRLRFL